MSRCSVGARNANSTSPAIGVTAHSGPGAVMMPPIVWGRSGPNFVNFGPGTVKDP